LTKEHRDQIEIDIVGGTGNSLPVLRSNKRLLLKAPFVPIKAETLCPLWLTSPFVENLLAFGHRHKCRCHPALPKQPRDRNRNRYRNRFSSVLCLGPKFCASVRLDIDPDIDPDPDIDIDFDFKWGEPQLGLCA
jgi:hypothetical protein